MIGRRFLRVGAFLGLLLFNICVLGTDTGLDVDSRPGTAEDGPTGEESKPSVWEVALGNSWVAPDEPPLTELQIAQEMLMGEPERRDVEVGLPATGLVPNCVGFFRRGSLRLYPQIERFCDVSRPNMSQCRSEDRPCHAPSPLRTGA